MFIYLLWVLYFIHLLSVYLFIYLFTWLHWVLAAAHGIFVAACEILTAACGIFSWGMQALCCGLQDLVPWPGIKPGPPALGAWSLNHWPTREVPRVCLVLLESARVFQNDYHFSFSQSMNEHSCCSTYLQIFGVVSFLDFSHSNRYVVLICSSLMTYDVKHLFTFIICIFSHLSSVCLYLFTLIICMWKDKSFHIYHLYVFDEVSVQIICVFLTGLFIFLLLSFKSYLNNLDYSLLSGVSFANIFSHSEGCLFVLFMVSFAVQKLLSFIRSPLFIFVFISISLGGESKRIFLWFMSECSAYVFL